MPGEFHGWTETELLAGLRAAQEDYKRGGSINSASDSSGSSSSILLTQEPKNRIRAFQTALYILNPTSYSWFAAVGQNRTRHNYSGALS